MNDAHAKEGWSVLIKTNPRAIFFFFLSLVERVFEEKLFMKINMKNFVYPFLGK